MNLCTWFDKPVGARLMEHTPREETLPSYQIIGVDDTWIGLRSLLNMDQDDAIRHRTQFYRVRRSSIITRAIYRAISQAQCARARKQRKQ
jgi:hypothetical protein